MKGNRWNAKAFHRKHTRGGLLGGGGIRFGKTLGVVATLVIVGLATGAVGLADDAEDSKWVGVCHATGSEDNPYVYMVVARDGAEHGHHAQHEDDKVGVSSPEDCGIEDASAQSASQPTCQTHGSDVEAAAAEPAAANETGNQTGNESADAGPEGLCSADVAASAVGVHAGDTLIYTFGAESLGPDEANAVGLQSVLPDVGWEWTLGGADAADCTLDERNLSCDFGDLIAGDTRSVSVESPRCEFDCGDDVEADVTATAFNDADAANDVATAVVEFPACGATADEAEAEPQANETAAEPQANETAGNESDVDDTAGNETGGNETAGNESAAASEPGDVAVRQTTEQDEFEVVATIEVTHVSGDAADNVTLRDSLPDLRRPWLVEGADASACTLEDNELTCWFGDLEPGESKTVVVRAYTDRMPCGQHVTNTALVSADDDPNSANDRSSAGIAARAC